MFCQLVCVLFISFCCVLYIKNFFVVHMPHSIAHVHSGIDLILTWGRGRKKKRREKEPEKEKDEGGERKAKEESMDTN